MTNIPRAAHFLLIPELLYSPPNDAIINSYLDNGYVVDVYAPGQLPVTTQYGEGVKTFYVAYTWAWLLRNLIRLSWVKYAVVSGTSEDPFVIVGIVSYVYRKKSICLVDEIKSDSYRGDRTELWKSICRWAIRKSSLQIVNDESRIRLLCEYTGIHSEGNILVYPGCFQDRPKRNKTLRDEVRRSWGVPDDSFVIGSSGGFNLTAGADWLLRAIEEEKRIFAVIQPLGVSQLSIFLMKSLPCSERIFIQEDRLGWREAWQTAQGLDAGICIYTNQAGQFQNMGISSNRLCMFLAMGVPVITSRQESFAFIEQYECGIMVGNYEEFLEGISQIRKRNEKMKTNCERCLEEYIRPKQRFNQLKERINKLKRRRRKEF